MLLGISVATCITMHDTSLYILFDFKDASISPQPSTNPHFNLGGFVAPKCVVSLSIRDNAQPCVGTELEMIKKWIVLKWG